MQRISQKRLDRQRRAFIEQRRTALASLPPAVQRHNPMRNMALMAAVAVGASLTASVLSDPLHGAILPTATPTTQTQPEPVADTTPAPVETVAEIVESAPTTPIGWDKAETSVETPAVKGKPYETMTKDELLTAAVGIGVKVAKSWNKAKIIAALDAVDPAIAA